MPRVASFALLPLFLLAACTSTRTVAPVGHPLDPYREKKALVFEGTGAHTRKVTAANAEAQKYFDQGLNFSFGFNHDEAIRSYAECAKLDPNCAMAYWGMAYALGPNFNLPMDETNAKRAYAAIQEAIARKPNASEVEREMIDAMAARYENPPAADHAPMEKAYSAAMGQLWTKYPKDEDIGFIYAESMMNKHPWDQWTKDGAPKTETLEVIKTLEAVMALNINHPGANHMYIHALEGSQTPEKALAAAERLGGLTPGIGHMVHMPAHIYMRLGKYRESKACNQIATELDQKYFATVGQQGFYHVYNVHNDHFLVWTAMFEGRYEDALKSCADAIKHLPEPFQGMPEAGPFLILNFEVYIRFGKWEEILKLAKPREDQAYCQAMWHYARGVAFANTGKIEEARKEAKEFEAHAAKVKPELALGTVPAVDVLKVAREMLAGETAFKAGDHEVAFKHLRAAVDAEQALRYTEPSPWMMPTRHALGALLLDQGKSAEAEQCYIADLKWFPENGWSLHGLAECLKARHAADEAAKVHARFKQAWAHATVEIKSSCFCRPGE